MGRDRVSVTTLDIVTINLWGANGPARRRMDDLASWLVSAAPDVVLAQEVERVDGEDQARWLAGSAGFDHVAVVRTGRGVSRGEGLAVLSRHPVTSLPLVRLPRAALDHPRGLQQVDITLDSHTVRVANTHLAWRLNAGAARARQTRAVVDAVAQVRRPVLVGGDLNDEPGSPALQALEAEGFTDCCAGRPDAQATFDAANAFMWQPELAGRRVDHLLARGARLSEAYVVLDGAVGPVVSDHYGVRAVLRL